MSSWHSVQTPRKRPRQLSYTPDRTPSSMPRAVRRRPSQTGHYQGRLPRPKPTKRPGKFALNGSRHELERYGKAEHADCLYLGAQSAPAYRIGEAVGAAFIRMVMKRHYHCEYSSPDQKLRAFGSGNQGGSDAANATAYYFPDSIKFWRKVTVSAGAPTVDVPSTYSFGASDTVTTFAVWFCNEVFHGKEYGGTWLDPNSDVELMGYQFVEIDTASGGAAWPSYRRNGPVMSLEGQYLTVYSTVRMHLQNVTRADGITEEDTGAVFQSTRIDANPVKGKILRFSGPLPLIKDDRGIDMTGPADFGWRLQQDSNADGIIWPNISPVGQWLQLPSADQFRNCVGIASIALEPGAIKDYSLSFKFSGTLNRLMHGLREVVGAPNTLGSGLPVNPRSPLPNAMHQLGQSFMFALEKRLPTGNANVSINFHYENYFGAVFGGRRKTVMVRKAITAGATVADPQP